MDGVAMANYVKYGTEIFTVSDELQQDIAKKAKAWSEKQLENALFKKIYENMRGFLSTYKGASIVVSKYSIFD